MTPEHLHLITNHAPLFGLLAALLPLGWGLVRAKSDIAQVALVLAALAGGATGGVALTGDAAEEAFEHGAARPPLDAAGARWLETHEERAELVTPLVLVCAAGCAVAAFYLRARPAHVARAGGVGAALVAASLGGLVWVAAAGGKVRHPELRGARGAEAPATSTFELDED